MYSDIFFDFDGTIVDTSEGIVKSMNHAFIQMNLPQLTFEEIRKTIGPPLPEMFRILLKMDDQKLIQLGVTEFRKRYGVEGLIELEIYKGVLEMLQTLKHSGKRLYIVTSKPTEYIYILLKSFQIDDLFDDVTGVSLNGESHDKSERLKQLIQKHHLDKQNSVMVGDRPEDVAAAKYNNVESLAVSYGFGSFDDLQKAGAEQIVDSVEKLLIVLSQN